MPYLNKRWIGFFIFAATTMLSLVITVGYLSFKEGEKNQHKGEWFGVDLNSTDADNFFTNWTSPALGVWLHVSSFDPSKTGSSVGYRIEYKPLNGLARNVSDSTDPVAPAVPVRVLNDADTKDYPAFKSMTSQTLTQVMDGDINRYPFDVYTVDFTVAAWSSPSNGSYGTPVQITAIGDGAIQGFSIRTSITSTSDDASEVTFSIRVKRSAITKAYSILIILVMWLLSGCIFIAAMSVWFRERKVELPLIAISTALLFALPNVRNSQPGIPSIAGTTTDMLGFFWNMLLVACSAISLIINFIIKSKRDPATRPQPPVAPKDLEAGSTWSHNTDNSRAPLHNFI